jgi:hypothetical protein
MNRGTIYRDNSTRGDKSGKDKRHNCWRAEIVIHGRRYRRRGHDKDKLAHWLQYMAEKEIQA